MIYQNQCQQDFCMVGRDYIENYVSTCKIDCDQSFKRSNRIKDTVAATKSILNYLFIREHAYPIHIHNIIEYPMIHSNHQQM